MKGELVIMLTIAYIASHRLYQNATNYLVTGYKIIDEGSLWCCGICLI